MPSTDLFRVAGSVAVGDVDLVRFGWRLRPSSSVAHSVSQSMPLAAEVMPSVGGYTLAVSTTCTFVALSWRTLSTPVALS